MHTTARPNRAILGGFFSAASGMETRIEKTVRESVTETVMDLQKENARAKVIGRSIYLSIVPYAESKYFIYFSLSPSPSSPPPQDVESLAKSHESLSQDVEALSSRCVKATADASAALMATDAMENRIDSIKPYVPMKKKRKFLFIFSAPPLISILLIPLQPLWPRKHPLLLYSQLSCFTHTPNAGPLITRMNSMPSRSVSIPFLHRQMFPTSGLPFLL